MSGEEYARWENFRGNISRGEYDRAGMAHERDATLYFFMYFPAHVFDLIRVTVDAHVLDDIIVNISK